MDNYTVLLNELSEKMVKLAYDNIDPHIWACKNEEEKQRSIANYHPMAKMVISEMAIIAEHAYNTGIGGTAFKFVIREYLQSRGLSK